MYIVKKKYQMILSMDVKNSKGNARYEVQSNLLVVLLKIW